MPAASPSPTPAPRRPFRRRLLRGVVGALAVVAIIIAALPTLISWSPALRNYLVRQAKGGFKGEIEFGDVSLGWFSPLRVTGVVVRPPQGSQSAPREPALSIESVESERSLADMLLATDDLRTFRFERPTALVEFVDGKSNFAEMFTPTEGEPMWPRLQRLGARVQIVDGALRWKSNATNEPWQIVGVNLGAALRPASKSPSGKPEILVDRGTLVDHEDLTVGMCDDVLKYVNPTMANISTVRGDITIELDDWRLPLGDLKSGELGGRLTMHSVDVGPGPFVLGVFKTAGEVPIVGGLIKQIHLPSFVQIARESTVPFKMVAGGRIHHENLRFSVADVVDVNSRGTVGLDQTLDLVAELGIHPPNPDQRRAAILRVLTAQGWPVNVRGTLHAPEIDISPLKYAAAQLAAKYLVDLESGKPSIGADVLQRLNDVGLPVQPNDARYIAELVNRLQGQATGTAGTLPTTAGDTALQAVGAAFDILHTLQERRAQQMQSFPPQAPPQFAPNGAMPPAPRPIPPQFAPNDNPPPGLEPQQPEPPARRPLLRKGLRMLLEAADQAIQPQPPPRPPAPTATPSATQPNP